jgi:VWFA-related protein
MIRTKLIMSSLVMLVLVHQDTTPLRADQQRPTPMFRSSVDLVRVSAVVRDRRGRFVSNLASKDFEIVDGGIVTPIADFQHDLPAVSVALLMDVSGSMENRLANAREAATLLLGGMRDERDEAAVFTFDTQLDEVAPFTTGLQALPARLNDIRPFGATSLHDAIAGTARRLTLREGLRRAVVVFTDGTDTASRLTPAEVSAVASAIDVPVYIVGIVPAIDNPASDISTPAIRASALTGALADLATWTGGHTFIASSAADRSMVAREIIDELRHQYVIAFQSSGQPGWHPLVIRMRNKDLVVRARSGYNAGQSRPVS